MTLRQLGDPDALIAAELESAEAIEASPTQALEVSALSNGTIFTESQESQEGTTPLLVGVALGVILLLLAVFFRAVSDVALAVAGLLLTIIWAVGFQGLIGPGSGPPTTDGGLRRSAMTDGRPTQARTRHPPGQFWQRRAPPRVRTILELTSAAPVSQGGTTRTTMFSTSRRARATRPITVIRPTPVTRPIPAAPVILATPETRATRATRRVTPLTLWTPRLLSWRPPTRDTSPRPV